MDEDTQGGCLCGAVRYRLTAEPLAVAICHCTHCQRQSGAMFSTNLVIAEGSYVQKGDTQIYQDLGDSGQPVFRHFCRACGSPLISKVAAMPGVVMLKAGTLDDRSGITPTMEVYTDHAADWIAPVQGTRRFAQAAN